MPTIIGSYSLRNLVQSLEFLLKLAKDLNDEIDDLEIAKGEVFQKQKEAQKQGLLVKKMANYMSQELDRFETEKGNNISSANSNLSQNLEKLTSTETRLQDLRKRLNEFVEGDDAESLKIAERTLSIEFKHYESFLLDLNNFLSEKIATFEKIVNRLRAEKRESQQQKLLLKEMVDLFNNEIDDLEKTLAGLKS